MDAFISCHLRLENFPLQCLWRVFFSLFLILYMHILYKCGLHGSLFQNRSSAPVSVFSSAYHLALFFFFFFPYWWLHCPFIFARYHCSELHHVTSIHHAFVAWMMTENCCASLRRCKQKIKLQNYLPERAMEAFFNFLSNRKVLFRWSLITEEEVHNGKKR